MGIPILSSVNLFNPANIDGCVLYLPLWKTHLQGSQFLSQDKYGHLCTVTGAVQVAKGRDFDGTDDNINCGSASVLDNIAQKTWEAWIYYTVEEYVWVMSKGTNYLATAIGSVINARVYHATTTAISNTSTTISLGAWVHLVITYDFAGDKKVRIYKNGTAASYTLQQAGVGNLLDESSYNMRIGSSDTPDSFFDGIIGEVRVYNRVLTLAEIQHNYLATKWRYS